ncbi:C2 family cysteine protease [Calothrix anomala]|uniref:Pre-peptidase C-terminal domain-containing protein n=1 Tax=Calothrix anomala FACHB-343 TaxID=2692894 RepID=A0ABR8B3Q1_9CYAN|nr:C2 family cysteine protease [Calothrix anomala]MBD2228711.1 pre-peptidase C-terminal domain-containing protein [Calothrix anomala FACHB-343]
MTFDISDNTLNTALNINLNSNPQTFNNLVGLSDPNDFYRFNLSSRSSFSLSLDKLLADANVQIIRDYNLNGVVDTGEIITGCYTTGTAPESLKTSLESGTYFIRVYSAKGDTKYNLSVSAQVINSIPNNLQFNLNNTSLKSTDTLSINNAWVYDDNGVGNIARVDFRIKKSDGTFVNVADVMSFTPSTTDNRWGSFNYSLSLSNLTLANGKYSLSALAYDKSGAKSNLVEQTFSFSNNIAPTQLQFNLNNTNLKSTDTLSINGGSVYDANGVTDISRVDFRIKKSDGTFVDVVDVVNFTPSTNENRLGSFNYSLSLSNLTLANGKYSLSALAYDKSGAKSNLVEREFSFTNNIAPTQLQFNLNNISLKPTDTLSINGGSVYDANGVTDISRVDFRIKKSDGTFVDVVDVVNFTPSTNENRLGSFNYSLSLSNLTLANGKYNLSALAYDKSGAKSNLVEREFSFTNNIAPTQLQFNLNNISLKPTDTLSINSGLVYDANGVTDISRVDFRIKKSDGTFVDVVDVVSFTPSTNDNRLGSFNYSLSLSNLNLANGKYSLSALAYDKSGAKSDVVEREFTIQITSDWFSQNLIDKQIIDLTRLRAADNKLSRQDMIDIFRDARDGGLIDSNELQDLRKIVSESSRFNIDDHVRVLSNKVINSDVANKNYKGSALGNLYAGSSATQMDRLIDKWFLGGDRPTAPTGFTMTYQQASGSLFGSDGTFNYQDVKQGFLGDCYFLASLGATARQQPSAITNMFIDNGDGTFTVRFYGQYNGKVTTASDYVTVDRWLPTNVSGEGYTGQRFAKYDNLNLGLWVALAEKAYAQFAESGLSQRDSNANSYGSIEGGWGYRVMPSLTGISGGYYADTSWSNTGTRSGAFLSLSQIATMLTTGKAMTADTISNPGLNIVGGHEYTIISADTTNGTLTLYNPWGVTRQGETNGVLTLSYNDFRNNFLIINAA